MYILLIIFLAIVIPEAKGQPTYHVAGLVTDENSRPLPGSHVIAGSHATITDPKGRFIINNMVGDTARIIVSFIGYHTFDTLLLANGHHHLRVQLKPSEIYIDEVKVSVVNTSMAPSLSRATVNNIELSRQMQGTLLNTLDRQAGFNAMNVGVSASKPVIRGMGFNRVVVVTNGIKQEGQQWGADHGLEIDPFLAENVEIIKGATSIDQGSGAIGGVIDISTTRLPPAGITGSMQVLGRSINETAGGSLLLQGSNNRHFFKTRVTLLDYGDYRVPTDNIIYLSRVVPIENRRLKNSAGQERNIFLQGGIVGQNWRTSISASRFGLKTGFFPGAHGVPDLNRVRDDGNSRNIGMPYQNVEHYKVTSNTTIQTPHSVIITNLGFQSNHRQEWSLFHTHFPNQQPPINNRDLELEFNLQTLSGNSKWNYRLTEKHSITAGIQGYWQNNTVGGYGFLLPGFDMVTGAIFARHTFRVNQKVELNGAIRYDKTRVEIQPFFDPILHEFMISTGRSDETARFYAQRAREVNRQFGSFSWLAGLNYRPGQVFNIALNAGKSFRVPTAGELAANGIHHGSFRHETGDSNLEPERGYFADARFEVELKNRSLTLSPYLYKFSNYIFLSPTTQWSHLPHAGQIFRYMQSGALITGLELIYHEQITNSLKVEINGEWIYNFQLPEEGLGAFPLPFSPPANLFGELQYSLNPDEKDGGIQLMLNSNLVARQNRVARNEATTPGYMLFGARAIIPARIDNLPLEITIQGNNLLNRRHYNHISFYRKLEIPEPGRNIQASVKLTF